jgi:interferon gamma-inducible protein 30
MAAVGWIVVAASLLGFAAASSVVDVAVYYESMCPDSQQFVQEQLLPTYSQLQDYMNVELIPYGNAHTQGQPDHYTFTCQHGPEECYGNMVQTCYINLVNNTESRIKFVNCAFNFPNQRKIINSCIESKELRRLVKKCTTSSLGLNLENQMAKKTDALDPPHTFIPWITINGKGGRDLTDKACDDFMSVLCDAITGDKPEVCNKKKLNLFKRFRNYYL